MSDSDEFYDGHPLQPGLREAALTGVREEFSIFGLRECVVTDVKFIDEVGNRSRRNVEYTVRDIQSGSYYHHVRRAAAAGGIDDGDDDVLHPTQKTTNGRILKPSSRALDTDGDHVLVGFINGSASRGVIVGVFVHPKATYGATRLDGERRYRTHKGTVVTIKSDGTYEVLRKINGNTSSIALTAAGNIEVRHHSGAVVKTTDDGSIVVTPAPGRSVELGGENLTTLLDGVVTGRGIDPFTGQLYSNLGNSSSVVKAKK